MTAAKNIAASVRARLMNRARADNVDFQLMFTRYALERVLYRLSVSAWAGQFLLKGALLFDVWFDQPQRPTRDIDLLGFGPADLEYLNTVFEDVSAQPCDDGMTYDAASVRVAKIRKETGYEGVRVTLVGWLDGARCKVQVDVGYGDAVMPAAESVLFPVVLDDMPPATLRAYPVYTVVAEKYQAIVVLGLANTRMKDYFDLWFLARHAMIDRATLAQAIQATFERRKTPVPKIVPLGLSLRFATDPVKLQQWKAFLSKNKLSAADLAEVVDILRGLVGV